MKESFYNDCKTIAKRLHNDYQNDYSDNTARGGLPAPLARLTKRCWQKWVYDLVDILRGSFCKDGALGHIFTPLSGFLWLK